MSDNGVQTLNNILALYPYEQVNFDTNGNQDNKYPEDVEDANDAGGPHNDGKDSYYWIMLRKVKKRDRHCCFLCKCCRIRVVNNDNMVLRTSLEIWVVYTFSMINQLLKDFGTN